MAPQIEGCGGPALNPRDRSYHGFGDGHISGDGVLFILGWAFRQIEPLAFDKLLQRVGVALHHEHVTGFDGFVQETANQPALVAHDADNGDSTIRFLLEFGDRLADDRAHVANAQFGNVVRNLEALLFRRLALQVLGKQAPADRDDESNANQGQGQTDGRKIKHAEALAKGLLSKLGDQQIRRRTDHCQHATEQRGKGQWH